MGRRLPLLAGEQSPLLSNAFRHQCQGGRPGPNLWAQVQALYDSALRAHGSKWPPTGTGTSCIQPNRPEWPLQANNERARGLRSRRIQSAWFCAYAAAQCRNAAMPCCSSRASLQARFRFPGVTIRPSPLCRRLGLPSPVGRPAAHAAARLAASRTDSPNPLRAATPCRRCPLAVRRGMAQACRRAGPAGLVEPCLLTASASTMDGPAGTYYGSGAAGLLR
jgi:hypothetical protein